MTEIPKFCAWVDGVLVDLECEEPATFSLKFKASNTPGNFRSIESCDHHLADLARGIPDLYAVDTVTIEEIR